MKNLEHLKEYPSQGLLNTLFYLDENYNLRRKVKSSCHTNIGDTVGGVGKRGYHRFMIGTEYYYTHRVIYIMLNGPIPEGHSVDHIDFNKINNWPTNLRLVNYSQSRTHTRKPKNNTSGVKGISWCSGSLRWVARIMKNGTRTVNSCDELWDAICWRMSQEYKLHKEFSGRII